MTGTAAEVEHRSSKTDQVPPDQGRVVLMGLPPAVEEGDVLLGRNRVGGAHGPQTHCCRVGRRCWRCWYVRCDDREVITTRKADAA